MYLKDAIQIQYLQRKKVSAEVRYSFKLHKLVNFVHFRFSYVAGLILKLI